ncbi:MAG TPA: hypothetical protein VKB79_23135 [Bryobacteraceae bacterium]|nr:hypothetical protein [Bryobacteraceae bacterium]
MDLRSYYRKIRETEELIDSDEVVIVSLVTPEGGKAGVLTEAPRAIAARQIAEGRARLATDEEDLEHYELQRESKERIEREMAARRLQVVVVPAHDAPAPKERS